VKVRVESQFKISNSSEALENLDDSWEINRALENIKETIGISDKSVRAVWREAT
jgi:hypothetical protein